MLWQTLIASLCVIGAVWADSSPVFLWGANSPQLPALTAVSQDDFAALIEPLLQDHMVVAFQEKALSSVDFLCANVETSQSCYAHLQQTAQKSYYAKVDNPAQALRAVANDLEFNSIDKTGELQKDISCAAGKVVIVNFNDAHKTRGESLEAHDAAIAAISKQQSAACPTVYLYYADPATSTLQGLRRVRRAAGNEPQYLRVGKTFLIYFTQLFYQPATGTATQIEFAGNITVNTTEATATAFQVTLDTTVVGKPITFDIYTSQGYYIMSNLYYGTEEFYTIDVNALTNFSYYCGNATFNGVPTTANPNPASLLWNSLQFQAPFNPNVNDTFSFGDPWHCVGFVSPAVLMSLFVCALLLAVLFLAVCWIMDINTNDRFDDPKGKTITINTGGE